MARPATATKVSISVPDSELLEWAKELAESEGKSLSAVFTDAVRFRRQLDARRDFLATWPERPKLTDEDRAAIRAERAGGPRYEPRVETETVQDLVKAKGKPGARRGAAKKTKSAARSGPAKRRNAA